MDSNSGIVKETLQLSDTGSVFHEGIAVNIEKPVFFHNSTAKVSIQLRMFVVIPIFDAISSME